MVSRGPKRGAPGGLATISDVAAAAGVSAATVSRVLNGTSNVAADKAKRVRRAAERLGYQPFGPAQALRQADEVLQEKNLPADTLHNLACVHALCAAAAKDDKTAAKAVDLLKQAVAKGYKDVAQLKKDSDLDGLRQRDDFKKLLEELEAKQR